MLTFKHFHQLAGHISIVWRGFFTDEEIYDMATNDYKEYMKMVRDPAYVSEDMRSLMERLYEDVEGGTRVRLEIDTYNELAALMAGRG